MFKFILLLFFLVELLAWSHAESEVEKFNDLTKHCQKEKGISAGDAIKLRDSSLLPSTDKEKCYLQCIYEGLGLIKEGIIDVDTAIAESKIRYAGNDDMIKKAHETITYCVDHVKEHADDKCYYGYEIKDCVQKAGKGISISLNEDK